jgi:hypothetical protein
MANVTPPSSSGTLEEQREEILRIFHQLMEDLTQVYFLPGYLDYQKKMEELSNIRNRDLEGVISILSNLNMPAIIAFAGGSSCGKSTLFNTIAGEIASVVSLLRPTTAIPVLYHHSTKTVYFNRKDFMERYEKIISQELIPQTSENRVPRTIRDKRPILPKKLILYPSQQPDYSEEFALLDTPDVDTTEVQNRDIAHDLFHVASLILFVFSPEKYADNRLWEDVQYLRSLGKPIAFVLNKLTPEHKTEGLVDDFKHHLQENVPNLRDWRLEDGNRELGSSPKPQAPTVFYVDKEQPQTENYPQRLSQKVRDEFYEFFNALLNPVEKKRLKYQLVSRSLRHVTERLETLISSLQEQQKELLNLENQIEKDFQLSIEAMIHEIKLVGGLNSRAIINLVRENLASLIGSLNVTFLKGVKALWEWFTHLFGREEKDLKTSRDAIEHFIEGDFDKKFSILENHLDDVEDHVQNLLKESYIGTLPETVKMLSPTSDSIQALYEREVTEFKKWLESEVRLKTQTLREVGTLWINLIDSVILVLILLLFAYIGVKGGTITGEEAAAAAGISWVWDWLVTRFWGREELERFMVTGGERYLAIFKNLMNKRKQTYLEFVRKHQTDLEGIHYLADHTKLLRAKLEPFMERMNDK